MPTPIRLTDSQLDVVIAAAEMLRVVDRDPFFREVAERLRGHEIGDGLLHRVIAKAQRHYLEPPQFDRRAQQSKWR
jgi:hypothetical protein